MSVETAIQASAGTRPGKVLEIDQAAFAANYNRRPFIFNHRLGEHPLLQMESLVALANRLRPDKVMHTAGRVSVAVDFDEALRAGRGQLLTVDQVLADMKNADAYVLLHRVDEDPEYRELLETVIDDIRQFTEPVDPDIRETAAYIFIASPGAVTPYHMDREMNFLCQVRGTKQAQLWDQDDTEILSEPQIETIFSRLQEPKPPYRPEYGPKAMNFTLQPGTGLHQPFLAPHAMQNGEGDFSIAMAFTFRTRATVRRIAVHQANWRLRRLGLHPSYGKSPAVDTLKYRGMRTYLGLRSKLGRG
jgi:hypothetical protein